MDLLVHHITNHLVLLMEFKTQVLCINQASINLTLLTIPGNLLIIKVYIRVDLI